jgi:hypothetical protein
MSASQEMLHETLPLASSAIFNPAIIAGSLAALGTGSLAVSRLHEKWHQYVDIGHVGVWLDGDAILRKKSETTWIPHRFNPLNLPAYNPFRKVPLSEEDIMEGESRYKIVPPDFYWVLPGKKLQPVPVAQQTDLISFERESKAEDRRKLQISASLYWRISPEDDGPVLFLKNIESRKIDKKADSTYSVEELKQQAKERVQSVGRACLGFATAGYSVDKLLDLDNNEDERRVVTNKTLNLAAERLGPVGLELLWVDINPITRNDFEVHKQGLESLNGSSKEDKTPEDKTFAAGSAGGVIGARGLHLVGGAEPQTDDAA